MKRFIVLSATVLSLGSLTASATGLSQEMKDKLYPLDIVNLEGSCNFKPDGSDAMVPCVVVADDKDYYAILGVLNPDYRLMPLEVRRVSKADPQDQETIWDAVQEEALADEALSAESDEMQSTAVSEKLEYF